MDTQTQIERLIELAIVQRTELKELVAQLPQLREHLSTEIEKAFDEAEPQLRAELEEWTTKQAADKTAALGVALEAKIGDLAKSLEISTQARYNAIIAEREENARLAAQAEAKIAEHAASLPSAVKEIVSAELARFPRAGEIDQLRKEFAEPRGLNPRGKWQAGETYNRLDLVTVNGDSFVSNIDGNKERPSRSATNWTLNAARGMGGGSGFTSLNNVLGDPSAGQIVGSEGGQYVRKTLVAGANITINETASAITIIGDEGQISLQDGTAAAPSLFFTNDTDTGIYRPAANTLGISVSGTQIAYFDANGITTVGAGGTFDGSVHAANGNANNPSFSFSSDQDTGFFRHQPNEIGVSLGGTQKATLTSTTFSITPNLVVSGTGSINGTSIPASKTLVVTTDKLSALASTSSSELAGVISDETGTGALVFANTPTLVTPNIGAATGTSFNLTGSGTLGTTLTVNGTTDSSSKDTGAIVTEGGLGVEKSASIGGNLTVSGSVNVGGGVFGTSTGNDEWKILRGAATNYATFTFRDSGSNTEWAIGRRIDSVAGAGNFSFYSSQLGGNALTLFSATGNATLAGNLTVSGTGTSSVGGNFGAAASVSSWDSNFKAIQAPAFTLSSYSTTEAYLTQNAYYAAGSGWLRVNAGYASQYLNVNGEHRFLSAGTSTAGSSISFAEQMRLFANGNLFIGASPVDGGQKLQVAGDISMTNGSGNGTLTVASNANKYAFVQAAGNTAYLGSGVAGMSCILVSGNGTTALTLDSSQNATFAKGVTLTAGGITLTDTYTLGWGNGTAYVQGSVAGSYVRFGTAGSVALTLDGSQNATFAGTISATKSVAGAYDINFRNTNSGSAYLRLRMGNDTSSDASILYAFGSGWSTSGPYLTSSAVWECTQSGGISIYASQASGAFRIYTGANTTARMTVKSDGKVNMSALPTSSAGLSTGDIWNDSGTLKIV